MGCAKSTPVIEVAAPCEDFGPTPKSVANCSVEGIFYCESSPVFRRTSTRNLSISKVETTIIRADVNENLIKLIDRFDACNSEQTVLRLFYAWRLLTMKSKDALATNLVNLAKQLPELTRIALPQQSGM
jgi:hypothetical protein